jgi:hypothetical protein
VLPYAQLAIADSQAVLSEFQKYPSAQREQSVSAVGTKQFAGPAKHTDVPSSSAVKKK